MRFELVKVRIRDFHVSRLLKSKSSIAFQIKGTPIPSWILVRLRYGYIAGEIVLITSSRFRLQTCIPPTASRTRCILERINCGEFGSQGCQSWGFGAILQESRDLQWQPTSHHSLVR